MDFDQRSCADGLCGWLGRRIALFLALTFLFPSWRFHSSHHIRAWGGCLMFHIQTVRLSFCLLVTSPSEQSVYRHVMVVLLWAYTVRSRLEARRVALSSASRHLGLLWSRRVTSAGGVHHVAPQ